MACLAARPIAALSDPCVIVSPVDATFIGQCSIAADATISLPGQTVDAKRMRWSVHELLADSVHAGRVAGATFMHSASRIFDCHRWHSPVAGRIVEARIIRGKPFSTLMWSRRDGRPAPQVSSVVITAEVGAVLRKGEETGYFRFGGSDFVRVFEGRSELSLTCRPDSHAVHGEEIGICKPGAQPFRTAV